MGTRSNLIAQVAQMALGKLGRPLRFFVFVVLVISLSIARALLSALLASCSLFPFFSVRLTPAANYEDVGEGSKVYIVVAAFGKLPHPSAARAPMRRWPAFLHRLTFPSFRSVSD